MANGSDFAYDRWGPTNIYVDFQTGWAWNRPGGDWIDSTGTRYGASSFTSPALNAVASGSHTYTFDATAIVQHARSHDRWLAVLLNTVGGVRTINTPFNTVDAAPSIVVTYADATTATLRARVVAAVTSSSAGPVTNSPTVTLPAFVEFDRPTKVVNSATMTLPVAGHYSGTASLQAFLLDPPTNSAPIQNGLAVASASLDATLSSVPGVIGTMRFQDGSTLGDWVVPTAANFNGEAGFSPEYWGGAADTSKWPYVDRGKFINAYAPGVTDVTLVRSNYASNGFVPVAAGLGALRIHVPAASVVNGGSYPDGGTVGTSMVTFMPPADFGTLDHLFVRYYMLIGTPGTRTPADRLEVNESGIPFWTELFGKTGIQPDASNAYGGNSGGSGGNYGWQMRLSWGEVDANVGGPDEGGQYMGFHLYDYLSQNPRGYNYGNGSDKPIQFERWNDLGGILYAGRQYCIETEIKLNTIDVAAKTWAADGELRAWVDGRLTYEQTGMIFRTTEGLAALPTFNAAKLRPTAKNGITRLWMNWFHGGHTQNTVDRNIFYSGLVWARNYIGPMKP